MPPWESDIVFFFVNYTSTFNIFKRSIFWLLDMERILFITIGWYFLFRSDEDVKKVLSLQFGDGVSLLVDREVGDPIKFKESVLL